MPFTLHRSAWGIGAASAAVVIAALAAFVLAPDGHFAFGVESASSAASGLVHGPSAAIPRIYALFAGMVAAFNPCGFALLPAYLGLYLQTSDAHPRSTVVVLSAPITVSLTVTAAFLAVFGAVGLAVGAAGAVISGLFPIIGLAVGIALIIAGGAVLSGRMPYAGGESLADRLGPAARQPSIPGYFAYGIAYALASLGCTLPVFLTVVGSALLARGWLGEIVQFLLYGLGMAAVLAALTIGTAAFKTQLVRRVRNLSRATEPISAVLLLVVGAYVVYYWLTLGGLLRGAG